MSTTKKVLIAIFSILIIAAFAFLITWGVINFNKVKEGLSGTGLYTKDDVDNAYNDGYNTALSDKGDYEQLLNTYKDTITKQTDTISQLNSVKATLDNNIQECRSQISRLEDQRDALQVQIDLLNAEITDKDETIGDLTDEKQELIEQNTQTVNRLNAQITNLNSQIETLNTQIQVNMTSVSQLNNRISELQRTIAFYEEFVGKFETDEQALVTFEFAGSVYEVKVVNKGDKVIVTTPTSTEYLIFNGWTLDGEILDLETYTVTGNVRIIADVTYKYVVNFTVDGNTKSTQVVEKGNYATQPTSPRKNGYRFKYWTLDGETEVHFDQLPIMANTTFIAKFVELHKVDFLYANGDMVINTKSIEHGQTTNAPRMTLQDGEILNGWRVNGNLVDVGSYVINADTTFIADITRKNKVTFMVDDNEYSVQYAESGNTVTVPNPHKDGYRFVGWHLEGSEEIIDLSDLLITENITLYAKFEHSDCTVTFVVKGENVEVQEVEYGQNVIPPEVTVNASEAHCGWTLNGVSIDLENYPITENLTFVADIRKTYTAFFYYDTVGESNGLPVKKSNLAQIQSVTSGESPRDVSITLPSPYSFAGWTIDGKNVINLSSYKMTESTTFYALISHPDQNKTFTVTFKSEDGRKTIATKQVKWGERPNGTSLFSNTNSQGYFFMGWLPQKGETNGTSYVRDQDVFVNKDLVLYAIYMMKIYL